MLVASLGGRMLEAVVWDDSGHVVAITSRQNLDRLGAKAPGAAPPVGVPSNSVVTAVTANLELVR